MSDATARRSTERTDPDRGPIASGLMAIGLAVVSAIGGAAFSAIGLSILFELAPRVVSRDEQLRLIDATSQFVAEAAGLVMLIISYRANRGLPWLPGRTSILGLLKAMAFFGLILARMVKHLGPWIGA